MTRQSESSKWRKLIAPLVGATITALGVYAAAAQKSYSTDNDARMAVIERRVDDMESLKDDVKELSKEVHELIGVLKFGRTCYDN